MAHPKRKTSKARTRSRRANYRITTIPQTQECSNCGGDKLMHRACPTCGHYRGRQVVAREEYA